MKDYEIRKLLQNFAMKIHLWELERRERIGMGDLGLQKVDCSVKWPKHFCFCLVHVGGLERKTKKKDFYFTENPKKTTFAIPILSSLFFFFEIIKKRVRGKERKREEGDYSLKNFMKKV